jgi:hypothetical protein
MTQVGRRLRHVAERHDDGRQPDGQVDEEAPAPGHQIGQHATQQQPEGRAARGDRRPDAQSLSALLVVLEGGHDDRQRGGGDHGAADALQTTAEDQPGGVLGQAVEQAGDAEQRHACDEQPPAAEQVGHPAAQHQEPAEGQRVAVDDPLQVGAGEVQAALHRGQRDVDDRVVQHDHELSHAGDHQDQPFVAGKGVRHSGHGWNLQGGTQ